MEKDSVEDLEVNSKLCVLHSVFKNGLDMKCGYRPGWLTEDLIFIVRKLFEKAQEKWTPLVFVDFRKAFDSVDRTLLWKILTRFGIPPKLVRSCTQEPAY